MTPVTRLRVWGPVLVWMAVMLSVDHPVAAHVAGPVRERAPLGRLRSLGSAAVARRGRRLSRVHHRADGGAALEVWHAFLAMRTTELSDANFDAAGACIGTIVCRAWGMITSGPGPSRGLSP